MATLPPLDQLVGTHGSTYDALFRMADTAGNGIISAMEAAAFMKKSSLSEVILSQIWEMADVAGKGYLDKHTFSVAMKLIAVAQTGQETTSASLAQPHPPPNMGPLPEIVNAASSPEDGWSIPPSERTKYNQIFNGLLPVNGLLSGDKVKPVLINSKLPMDILGRVWDMSDIDSDGFLDREEFSVAMHLVYKALEKEPVPTVLPPDMIPTSKRRPMSHGAHVPLNLVGIGAEGRASPALGSPAIPGVSASGATVSWVINPMEQMKFDEMFFAADLDKDGFVNGVEIKDIFIQSGVPQTVLAHIWNLCDGRGLGKLNKEQFALAMYLIQQRLAGVEPPQKLPPNMVPPSMRPPADASSHGADAIDTSGQLELDNIGKEIEQLKQEKMALENEKAQREADIRIRKGEAIALQKELDAINSTVSQLQLQKGEAQKRLDDLGDTKVKLEVDVKENREKCEEEMLEISKLKAEIATQASLAMNREAELTKLQSELTSLRREESALEQKVGAGKSRLDQLASTLTVTNTQVDQAQTDIEKLKEAHAVIHQAIEQYSKLIAGDPDVSEAPLVNMELFSTKPVPSTSTPSRITSTGPLEDPFASKDPFSNGGTSSDPFVDDPFKGSDPFGSTSDPFGADPFANEANFSKSTGDAFSSSANSEAFESSGTSAKPSDDPWASAFSGGSHTTATANNDPFGAFGDTPAAKSPHNPADPFGTGVFTTNSLKPRSKSPAPPRPKSPAAPSLPPKQKKAPPPPRPPMPSKAKSPVPPGGVNDPFEGGHDPFGAPASAPNDAFADFADFNTAKFTSSPTPSSKAPSSSEAEQLAWATQTSQQEAERQRRLADQEKADLEMAIALSKAELTHSSDA